MRQILLLLAVAATVFTSTGCGPRIYEAPNVAAAVAAHSIIAILPPTVNIQGRKKDDPEMIRQAAAADAITFQREMYSWMLRRKQQGKIRGLEIMDPETTIVKLERAGWSPDSRTMTPGEMAEALGVDAVITSVYNTTKPMSEGAAVALGVLFGVWGTTNQTTVNLTIHDGSQGMLWNYDWVASGTFSSSEMLVDQLMRNASRRMPYAVN